MFTKIINWITDRLAILSEKHRGFHIVLFSLLTLPIFIIAIFSYVHTNSYLTEMALSRRQSIAFLSAAILKEKFDHIVNISISLATRVKFRQLIKEGEWQEAIKILSSVPKDFPFIERLFLTDQNGIELADFPELPGGVGKDFSFRDWYKGVSKNWGPYVSEVYKRTAEPQYNVIAIASPIKDENQKALGILVMQLRLDAFFDWSRKVEVGPSGFIYFLDQYGHVVAHPSFPYQGEIADFSAVPVAQKVLNGERGVEILFNSVEKEEMVVVYEPVSKYGWGVIAQQPTYTVFAARNRELRFAGILYGLIILLNAFLSYLILRALHNVNLYRQREKILLESIGDGLVAIDRNWNVILWNRAASLIAGWRREKVLGKPLRNFLKFVREKDRTENITFIEEAMLFGRVGYLSDSTVLITKDGKEIPTGDSAAPIFDSGGSVTGAIIVFRDTSREREAQLLRSDFAYASHQLRTPVNKALWSIESILEEQDLKKLKEGMRNAYLSVQSVHRLVEQLLRVSEIDQGLIMLKFESVRIAELFDRILKVLDQKAKIKDIKINVGPISAVASIDTDRRLLEGILLEILDNAIEYSPKYSEVIVVVSMKEDGTMIEIRDFGVGILEDQQTSVFTKFFRGGNINTTESVGAGLGLFISREYVKLLNGRIWFKSREGKGTTFYIFLPAAKA